MLISIQILIFHGMLKLLEYTHTWPWKFKHFKYSSDTLMFSLYLKWGEKNTPFCCLTELCSLPVSVFGLQHPAPNWKSGAGDQSWGVCLRGALPLHRHRSHLPFHPSSQRSCNRLNSGLSTQRSIKQRTMHCGTSNLRTKYSLLNQL